MVGLFRRFVLKQINSILLMTFTCSLFIFNTIFCPCRRLFVSFHRFRCGCTCYCCSWKGEENFIFRLRLSTNYSLSLFTIIVKFSIKSHIWTICCLVTNFCEPIAGRTRPCQKFNVRIRTESRVIEIILWVSVSLIILHSPSNKYEIQFYSQSHSPSAISIDHFCTKKKRRK